ncbi:hypothetical protein MH109_04335 [Bacillus altitudinis]|uniref:Uncharacterized protein n=1 Tax=Bacillus altitudinis TaxID=293387 RepID=A0A653P966_BACAB|nr:hypothetical protein [Bacillus altitudinis]MDN0041491.1 hypothetical protein [Bacillus aerophilus]MCM3063200.1 hypothetical protein [Bacillus altitudinis]MCM3075904.1 hypothetical protein [Bacillus altitudinis]MCY7452853.1 hypothetical protein [Bacillus altitudinis]MCY7693596.1 hypothetical protein [Bacillus altitudinis]
MDQETEDAFLNLQLKKKEQWYCDFCGEIIESDKEGMFQWDSDLDLKAINFRIVHHKTVKQCHPKNNERHLSDGHLHWYTGSEGLSDLLTFKHKYKLDLLEFDEIIRRLHVDYYEEARKYFAISRNNGDEHDVYEIGDYSQAALKSIIRKYGKKVW